MKTTTLEVKPEAIRAELLLTLTSPASHHDAAVQDDSNTMLFNRQKQLLPMPVTDQRISQVDIDSICRANPVPATIADVFNSVNPQEMIACAIVKLFLDYYNSQEGEGLFEGEERYQRLETRLRAAAVRSAGLMSCWNRLVRDLNLPIHKVSDDRRLLSMLSIPMPLQQLVLRSLIQDYRSIISIARVWHSEDKLGNEAYAEVVGREQLTEWVTLSLDASAIVGGTALAAVVDVPTVSSNSLRHQLIRAPGWMHLARTLSLIPTSPGQGQIPAGVEAIFVNGGNIRAGAKQPSNPHALAQKMRENYPLLDLLGGVTDSFDLGESRLSVASWLVCKENRKALEDSSAYDLPAAQVSVFDMIDEVTLTRQATERGVGQMIYNFETLCAGAQIVARLTLSPFTSELTRGAFVRAIDTYMSDGAVVAGQSSRGFGHLKAEWLETGGCEVGWANSALTYDEYLEENKDQLREWLMDGTLGTDTKVFVL